MAFHWMMWFPFCVKFTSQLLINSPLILWILIGLFPITNIYANLNLNTFSINWSSAWSFYYTPWDTFSIDAYGTNDIWEDIKDVRIKINFSDNSFTFSMLPENTYVKMRASKIL